MKCHEIMKPTQLIKGWTCSCFIFLHVKPPVGDGAMFLLTTGHALLELMTVLVNE